MRPYQVLPLWARVGQEAIAAKGYSAFPKATIKLFSIISGHSLGES